MRWDKNNWRTRYKLCEDDKNIYNEIFTVQAVEQETRIEYNGDQEVEFIICSERSQCAGNSGNDNDAAESEDVADDVITVSNRYYVKQKCYQSCIRLWNNMEWYCRATCAAPTPRYRPSTTLTTTTTTVTSTTTTKKSTGRRPTRQTTTQKPIITTARPRPTTLPGTRRPGRRPTTPTTTEEPMIFRDDFGDETQDPYLTGDIISVVNRNVTLEDTMVFEDDVTSIIVGGRDVHNTGKHPWLVGLRQDFE